MKPPMLESDGVRVYHGDALRVLRGMGAGTVDCCLTSPPYWSLRDYGTGEWTGGDEACDHSVGRGSNVRQTKHPNTDGYPASAPHRGGDGGTCSRCGARRVDQQLGLEQTPELYVERLVGVFREVWRVLKPAGTLWIVIGDSYNGYDANRGRSGSTLEGSDRHDARPQVPGGHGLRAHGLKSKDLVMVPAMLALALRSDGWYLRKDVIWAKPNPMPESVRDRPTSSHEHVLMLSKSPRYYYDQEGCLEAYRYDGRKQTLITSNGAGDTTHANYANRPGSERWPRRRSGNASRKQNHQAGDSHFATSIPWEGDGGRNLRDVWTIATEPTPLKHYATYPQALCDPVIRLACPPGGVVLDPFFGAGTTALVARRLGRRCVGVELSAESIRIAGVRLAMPDVEPLIPADTDLQLTLLGGDG